ncbi:MAG: aminotransferase class I/II-fold pyridoxal phosphate-dependent enzyme [Lapillicoccus sp.]
MSTNLQVLTPDRLRARRTLKWGTQPDDVLAMWVAEMDYPTAPAISQALHRAVDAETFGYPLDASASGLADVLTAELAGRHGWPVDPADVFLVADVMRGVSLALETFSGPDDAVVITTPVYMPFFDVVALSGRPQVHVPMTDVDGRPTFDLDGLDRALADGARTVLLCNPYNPLGRVFDRSELTGFAEVVERHGARVVADEIHAPLVFEGTHIPYATLSPATANHTLTLVSASKAWNLPGLKCAQVVTSNDADRTAWQRIPRWATVGVASLGIEASLAAYRDGEDWLQEVRALLIHHAQLVAEAVDGMPGVRHRRNEGTYLAWLDCTELELDVDPADWFLDHARVALSPGRPFRAPARRFARLNFATTTSILEESMERMQKAIENR